MNNYIIKNLTWYDLIFTSISADVVLAALGGNFTAAIGWLVALGYYLLSQWLFEEIKGVHADYAIALDRVIALQQVLIEASKPHVINHNDNKTI